MANTIEITGGVGESTSRMILKQEMERFGRVDVCHMGNRQNPKEEPPWIRFAEPGGAENALAAIKNGQVFIDGLLLHADYRSSRKVPDYPTRARNAGPSRRDLEVNSRDLFFEQERDGCEAAVIATGAGVEAGAGAGNAATVLIENGIGAGGGAGVNRCRRPAKASDVVVSGVAYRSLRRAFFSPCACARWLSRRCAHDPGDEALASRSSRDEFRISDFGSSGTRAHVPYASRAA
eukprot:CAMPEP_0176073576 /NCGR_PEP_ID=MMETSP0120_2-20121206/36764_1 /TAXON_ID=160619 /ORGANISM="Kryptoperidinium foliaceum, Strain CCMP 1326" /LENGTH=234 /DNA_ID=CAMNT_0017407261 /DNA_START=53 /DNA_END=755 /DNA_ORIENTATION=-